MAFRVSGRDLAFGARTVDLKFSKTYSIPRATVRPGKASRLQSGVQGQKAE